MATQKIIRELSPYLTAFIEVVDARAPELTRHGPMATWVGKTPRIVVLNKVELAEQATTDAWMRWYRARGMGAVALTATQPKADRLLRTAITERLPSPYRLAVVGLPNLGKSTLLNRMVGKNRVATGAKPGVTRGPQWIRLAGGWEWLDLPGVVTPARSKDWRLKILGVVPVAPEEMEDLAEKAWERIYPENTEPEAWVDWGRGRGFLTTGAEVDRHRTAQAVLIGIRDGQFGRQSWEVPPDGP